MGKGRKGIPGLSFSWKRAVGLSAAKGRLSRKIGIPLTAAVACSISTIAAGQDPAVRKMSGVDFLVDGRDALSSRVEISDCKIIFANADTITCAIYSQSPNKRMTSIGQLMIDSKSVDRNDLRFALTNCAGYTPSIKCEASVTGNVYDVFAELGVSGSRTLGVRNAKINWSTP